MKKFVITGVVALGMIFASNSASAQTIEELQAMIAQLTAQIAALSGGSSSTTTASGYTHVSTLRVGSAGTQVANLQACLKITADGAFGPMTKSAVMSFQASKGLVADGVVGPATGSAVAAACASTTTTEGGSSTTTEGGSSSNFAGTEGTLDGNPELGSQDDTQVEEGEEDVVIYSVEVELDDDGDLLLERVDVYFAETDGGGHDQDPWDYFESVALKLNGETIAEEDANSASDWSDDNDGEITGNATAKEYRMRFSGLDGMLESGEKNILDFAVTARNNIDSADTGATWNVDISTDGLKVTDGTGFSTTEGANLEDTFTIQSSDNGTLEFTTSSDDPDDMTITLDDTNNTDDILVFVWNAEADNQDILIEDLTIQLTMTDADGGGELTDIDQAVQTATLLMDGKKVSTESVSTTGLTDQDVTFDNIDLEIKDGDKVEFSVELEIIELDGNPLEAGDTIMVELDAADQTKVEQNSGPDAGDSITPTGNPDGGTHGLYVDAPQITLKTNSITKTCESADCPGNDEQAEAKFVFDVKAVGSDIYIANAVAEDVNEADTTYGSGTTFFMDENGGTEPTASTVMQSTADTSTNGWVVREGETKQFTVTINLTAAADGFVNVGLSSIEWATSDVAAGNAASSDYTFDLQPDWDTDNLYLDFT